MMLLGCQWRFDRWHRILLEEGSVFSVRRCCQLHEGSGGGWQLQEGGLGCRWVIFLGRPLEIFWRVSCFLERRVLGAWAVSFQESERFLEAGYREKGDPGGSKLKGGCWEFWEKKSGFEEEARSKLEVIERARKKGPRTFFFPRVSFPLCFCFFLFSLDILLLGCIVVDLWQFMLCSSWLTIPLLLLLVFKNWFNSILPPLWQFKERKRPFNPPICKPTNEEMKHSS